ncbi:hypothetical protein C9994_13325 [Marivirga lumbricoides]|uniref:Uncharacterized protein n=1 Tax=Marivirga lumbricoides TaxID=1046115 RepID=A0A2T4DH74_9BACT|nr:hypothetical protein C9994_13325 [Marivirga lumbricoides]
MEDPKKSFLHLYDHHASGLAAGTYEITVSQKIENEGSLEESSYQFTVGEELFQLTTNQIHSVYPAPNGAGSYAHHLPHILLNNSTLPWQARSGSSEKGDPFLFLLLFDESELSDLDVRTEINERKRRPELFLPCLRHCCLNFL